MAVKIPKKLNSKLHGKGNEVLAGAVEKSLATFDDWLDADMLFFPDFTDHSSKHLTRVLGLAELLIPDGTGGADNAWKVFTAQDAACLILAVLLHDAAMHLTPLSFLAIIRKDALPNAIAPFERKSWGDEWADFLPEAKRWDDKKLLNVFEGWHGPRFAWPCSLGGEHAHASVGMASVLYGPSPAAG